MRRSFITALAVPFVVVGLAAPAPAAKPAPKPKPVPNEKITITFTVSNPLSPGTVVATGPIAGTGTATASAKGKHIGRVHIAVETLTFGSDSVKVRAVSTRGPRKIVDAATCTATQKGKGAFQIKGGTGAYAKAKGHGRFTMTANLVGTKDANAPKGCSFKNPTGTIVIDATAYVTL